MYFLRDSKEDIDDETKSDISNDLVIIDLQMSRIGSPASDILYFLGSSTSLDNRKKHLDQWLKLYHKTLMDDLATFGHSKDIFTFEDLLDEVNHMWPFALETGIFHAQVNMNI